MGLRAPYQANGQTYACGGQWVTAAQAAREWTPADTFDFVLQCKDTAGAGNLTLYLIIRIFNAAGDTVVGTLYEGEVNNVVWASAAHTSRHNDGVAVQNSVSCPENGHIVVEAGFKSGYPAGFGAQIVVGEGASTALPLDDTETNTDLYPHLDFTYGAAGPDPIGPAGGIASGENMSGTPMMRGTIQSEVV
jgi:hypothetical protein